MSAARKRVGLWAAGLAASLLWAAPAPALAAPPGTLIILGAAVDPSGEGFDKAVKAAAVTSVTKEGEGWRLPFVAYLKKPPGAEEVYVVFYDIPPKHEPVTSYPLRTKATAKILMSEINARAEDGLKPGKYQVRITRLTNGKEDIFASTQIELK